MLDIAFRLLEQAQLVSLPSAPKASNIGMERSGASSSAEEPTIFVSVNDVERSFERPDCRVLVVTLSWPP